MNTLILINRINGITHLLDFAKFTASKIYGFKVPEFMNYTPEIMTFHVS